jgi:hypothetical protein
MEIATEIGIDAPPARVWQVLVDFPAYPGWNPFIRALRGEARTGARLDASIQPPGRAAMRFTPRVLHCAPEQELRWLGHFLVPRLFDGEHAFVLQPVAGGGTRFLHSERFAGLLVPLLFGTAMREATRAGFEAMNRALKARVEAG